jgi:hypothetical protein
MGPIRKTMVGAAISAAALWSVAAIAADEPGAMPGDESMTCEQIAAELAPYAKQMAGVFEPLAQTQKEVVARAQAHVAEAMPEAMAATAGALATSADKTGMASKVYGQAEAAMQAAQWNRALAEDKPLFDKANRQMNAAVAQAAPLQSNPRIQRLMQLAQQKNCH